MRQGHDDVRDFFLARYQELSQAEETRTEMTNFDSICQLAFYGEGDKRKIFDIDNPEMKRVIDEIETLKKQSKIVLVYNNSDFLSAATDRSISLATLKYLVENIGILDFLKSKLNTFLRSHTYQLSIDRGDSELLAKQVMLERYPISLMHTAISDFGKEGHAKVEYLVSKGDDINSKQYHNKYEPFLNRPLISMLANENWLLVRDFFSWLKKYDRSDFLWGSVDSTDTSILAFAVSMNAPMDIIQTILRNLTPNQVNEQDSEGRTALHFAALLRRFDVIPALLARGANPDLKDLQGRKAEAYLNYQKNDIYKFLHQERDIFPLRDEKAELNALQVGNRKDLMVDDKVKGVLQCSIPHRKGMRAWAATKNNVEKFRSNVDESFKASDGKTVEQVINALTERSKGFTGISLIDSIVNPDRKKKCERSFKDPLLSAAEQGDLESVELFLKTDSTDIQYTDPVTGDTALDIALQGENPHIILALWNADTNPSETGFRYTHEQESKGQEQQSGNNKTLEHVLRLASAAGGEKNEKLVEAILKKTNTNYDASGEKTGQTALHWAVKKGHLRIAQTLIQHGASLHIADCKQETPFGLILPRPDSKSWIASLGIHPASIPFSMSQEVNAEIPQHPASIISR